MGVEWDDWQHKNRVPHDTPLVEVMSETLSLDRSLRMEWRLGFLTFPSIVKYVLPRNIITAMNGSAAEIKKGLH